MTSTSILHGVTYIQVYQLSFEFIIVNVKVHVTLIKDLVRFLLYCSNQQVKSTVERINAIQPGQVECLIYINGLQ